MPNKAPKSNREIRKFRIISKRGVQIRETHACDLCGIFCNINWKYKETTKGEVTICPICKDLYRPTRIPYKNIIKTAFESSKKKH